MGTGRDGGLGGRAGRPLPAGPDPDPPPLRQQTTGELTPSQAAALASTDRLGRPTLGELATLESVQPPSMTRIVTALEEKGLVTRVTDAADRRVARVTVSETGRKVLEENRSLKTAFLAEQLHRLSPDRPAGPRRAHRPPRAAGGDARPMTAIRAAAAQTFRSLHVRNYRLYFTAQLISVSGTWMQTIAQAWLVLRLTGSGVDLGIVTGLQFLPMLLLGPYGGLAADRFDKRKLLYVTQSAGGLLALTLGVLDVTHVVVLWQIYVLASLLGRGHPLRQPGPADLRDGDGGPGRPPQRRQPQHGGDERLPGHRPGHRRRGHRAGGPGGLLLHQRRLLRGGAGGLSLMRTAELFPVEHGGPGQAADPGRLPYVWHEPALRNTLLAMAVIGIFAYNFQVTLALLAKDTFHGGPAPTRS